MYSQGVVQAVKVVDDDVRDCHTFVSYLYDSTEAWVD